MSDLRSDMSRLGQIYPVWGPDMFGHQKLRAAENRPGAKTVCLGPNKLTIIKLDNMELREITRTTRSNLNSWIQI
jgi:hypothetical protein